MMTLEDQIGFVRKLRKALSNVEVMEVIVKKQSVEMLMCIESSLENSYDFKFKSVRLKLVELICLFYGCTPEELTGIAKHQAIVNARKAYASIARFKLHDGLAKIGKDLNRDHSVISSLLVRVADDEFLNNYNARVIKQIEEQLFKPE